MRVNSAGKQTWRWCSPNGAGSKKSCGKSNQVRLASKRRLVVTLQALVDLVGAVVELLADGRKAQDSFVPVALQGATADREQVHDLFGSQPVLCLVLGAILADQFLQLVEAVVKLRVSPDHKVARGTGGRCRGVLRRDFRHRIGFGGRFLKERTMDNSALYRNKAKTIHSERNRLDLAGFDWKELEYSILACRHFAP
jgi:hypothetical protein